jgi:hypothetical protein
MNHVARTLARLALSLTMGTFAVASSAACTVETEPSSSEGTGAKVTTESVRAAVEGQWKGTFTRAGRAQQGSITLSYAPGLKPQCGTNTLAAPGELSPNCITINNMEIVSALSLDGVADPKLRGNFTVYGERFVGNGSFRFADSNGADYIAGSLADKTLKGSVVLKGETYEFTLTR